MYRDHRQRKKRKCDVTKIQSMSVKMNQMQKEVRSLKEVIKEVCFLNSVEVVA